MEDVSTILMASPPLLHFRRVLIHILSYSSENGESLCQPGITHSSRLDRVLIHRSQAGRFAKLAFNQLQFWKDTQEG